MWVDCLGWPGPAWAGVAWADSTIRELSGNYSGLLSGAGWFEFAADSAGLAGLARLAGWAGLEIFLRLTMYQNYL